MQRKRKPTFSILTVSKRTGWEETAVGSLGRQTLHPDKWVIVHERPKERTRAIMADMEFPDFPTVVLDAPISKHPSNLNASLNAGLRHITTDYVILYQDFIDLPKDCFAKMLALATPTTFVTTCTPRYDGTDDGRYTGLGAPRACRPDEWEANVALAPMGALRELGGFEEELDAGWSWDNVNVAERADILGYEFILDESNRPTLLPHEQTSKLAMEPNGERHTRIMEAIKAGKRPLKAPYL